MDEFVKLLDGNLEYVSHEIINDVIYIDVISTRQKVICPYCGQPSSKIHSHYKRSFQDLPIQGKKVELVLNNKKVFCNNVDCTKTTFAEYFDFLPFKAKKTKRLDDEIINIAMNVSSITATNLLKSRVANVGKSTVCNLLKKR